MEPSAEGIAALLRELRDRGKLSEFALRALIVFAERSHEPDVALEAFAIMQNAEIVPTLDVYSGILLACADDKRWNKVVDIYEAMPNDMSAQMHRKTLSSVVMAHACSNSKEVKLRGLEIFDKHEAKWANAPCNAALLALLETHQYEALFSLADDMKRHGLAWTPLEYKMMTLANIHSGLIDEAKKMLKKHVRRMNKASGECYRELIKHYEARHDILEATKRYTGNRSHSFVVT